MTIMENKESSFKVVNEKYITYSKAYAAISVILFHTWGKMSVDSYFLGKILLFFYTTHVPTFMLISGYLYSKHTVRHEVKHRLIKVSNLFLTFWVYVFVLSLFRIMIDLFSGTIIDFKAILSLTAHNMWYFPVLCISITIYEIIRKLNPKLTIWWIVTIPISILLLFIQPSIGKILIYIIIFMFGTVFRVNSKKAVINISLNVLLWWAIVFLLNKVDISSEGKNGMELCLMMILTLSGSFLIPSFIFLSITYLNKQNIILSKRISNCFSSVGDNSQMLYFLQFFIIIIVEFLRENGIVGYSVWECLLYSFLCFEFSMLVSSFVSSSKLLKRIFLKPIG